MALEAQYLSGDTQTIDYEPSGDVAAGEVVVLANACYVASRAIAAGALGSLYTTGVFKADYATSGGTITDGEKVYFNTSLNKITDATSGTTLIGRSVGGAASDSGTVTFRLLSPGA